MRGEALWPGKSDVDQLYLIKKTLGKTATKISQYFYSNTDTKATEIEGRRTAARIFFHNALIGRNIYI